MMKAKCLDNWSAGWRRYVEWDSAEKVYRYKGREILPLTYREQIEMPTHLQHEYYWSEIERIDGLEEQAEAEARRPVRKFKDTADYGFDMLMAFFDDDEEAMARIEAKGEQIV